MHYDKYEITPGTNALTYEFVSEGRIGAVPKLIVFAEMELPNFFNRAFGDKDLSTGDFDDSITTNNGDSFMVMVTVASTVYLLTDKYPNAMVFVRGRSRLRTRLYRMAIASNLEIINFDFEV